MNRTDIATRLRDVVAVPVTPFGVGGRVAERDYTVLLRRMVDGGVRVLTPNGNTGEFYALAPGERRRIVELTTRAAPDALVVAGVGLDLATAVADARAAHNAGAEVIMVHQPVHPFRSADGWVAYHAAIAEAVPGAGLVPYVRDPALGSAAFAALAAACPTLVGVKYAVPDPPALAALMEDLAAADLTWLCGLAELWAPSFAASGARGFTSGLANVDPRRSVALLDALRDGRSGEATRLWREMRPFEELRVRDASRNNVSVVKEALARLGVCRRDVRPPISPLDDEGRESVTEILRTWDVAPHR